MQIWTYNTIIFIWILKGGNMDLDVELTKEQIEKIKDINNPTITKIIEISDILEVDPIIVFKFFQRKEGNCQ